jgi:hypothetical protein
MCLIKVGDMSSSILRHVRWFRQSQNLAHLLNLSEVLIEVMRVNSFVWMTGRVYAHVKCMHLLLYNWTWLIEDAEKKEMR